MDERESKIIMNKKLEIKVLPELVVLFKESKYKTCKQRFNVYLDDKGRFYQYLRSERKRTYKDIEDDSREIRKEADKLLEEKNLEAELEDLHHKLEWHMNKEDELNDYKMKLDELMNQGIIYEEYILN